MLIKLLKYKYLQIAELAKTPRVKKVAITLKMRFLSEKILPNFASVQ